ncbi:calmodulin-like 3 [Apophysomyces sp. BC1034]|nr:calmodulin-like 3 [Apophysomyces sp. BC1015]KAG0175956.1 calmodulin-like 3 [Apophysomyces sp. BC1021]KAG0185949.1 calmodulin-like 3 [Apophysomyces sp. BC1034]
MNASQNVTPEELATLKEAFSLYDRNGDGVITVAELSAILKSLGIKDNQYAKANGDKKIDFNEFAAIMSKHAPPAAPSLRQWKTHPSLSAKRQLSYHQDDELVQVFQAFDKNKDGLISQQELTDVMRGLGERLTEVEIKNMMEDADTNRDGYIDLTEFKKLMPKTK